MSITPNGIRLEKKKRSRLFLAALALIELILSIVLVVSLGANFVFPRKTSATAGISSKLSYQGRLTDLSGNPLGGNGTNYCFRFSIYDSISGGSKIWPSGSPSQTTVLIKDGVFNTAIGDADTLDLDFTTYDTMYLNVEINDTATTCGGDWETLNTRQRIDAVGYARAAENVYSDLLRVQTGSGKVQIGTGSGAATPVYLGLDWDNEESEAVGGDCTGSNGRIWYNSSDSKARVCQGNAIRDLVEGVLIRDEGTDVGWASLALNFVGAGVSAAITNTAGVININVPVGSLSAGTATASLGQIVFSNANSVSFGLDGQTITASISAGGGNSNSDFTPFIPNTLIPATYVPINNSLYFVPFFLPHDYYFLRLNMFGSINHTLSNANSAASGGITFSAALYGRDTSDPTRITSFWSGSQYIGISNSSNSRISVTHPGGIADSTAVSTITYTANATNCSTYISTSIDGFREFIYPISSTLTVGQYWLAFARSSTMSNTKYQIAVSNMFQTQSNGLTDYRPFGGNSSASNAGLRLMQGFGTYSATSNAFPGSVTLSANFAINTAASFPFFNFSGWTTGSNLL